MVSPNDRPPPTPQRPQHPTTVPTGSIHQADAPPAPNPGDTATVLASSVAACLQNKVWRGVPWGPLRFVVAPSLPLPLLRQQRPEDIAALAVEREQVGVVLPKGPAVSGGIRGGADAWAEGLDGVCWWRRGMDDVGRRH
jgi:hypothetical protein